MSQQMEELRFRCPAYVAQKFWLLCKERNETPGGVLREFMLNEIASADAAFSLELKSITGKEVWEVYRDLPARKPTDTAPE